MNVADRLTRMAATTERWQLRFSMLALAVMMIVTVTDVTLRYLFNRPIRGAYDLVEVCLAIFVFNGLPSVFRARKHVTIDVVDHLAPPGVIRIFSMLGDLSMILVSALIFAAMFAPALQSWQYGDRKLELGLPIFIVWIAVILGMGGAIVAAVDVFVRSLIQHSTGAER